MNVSLSPALEEWVSKKVASGLYCTASEVVRDALRLLQEQEEIREMRLAKLRAEVMVGIEQAERGEVSTYSTEELKALIERIKAEGRAKVEGSEKARAGAA